MNAHLDELYFNWLYSQVCSDDVKPSRKYTNLFDILYTKEFVWFVPNDDNRAEDGKYLRFEFLEYEGLDDDYDERWMELECSMLELFICLSRRLAFETDTDPASWFWELLENLGLDKMNDSRMVSRHNVERVLDKVIDRTYEPDGSGGLFPLVNPKEDQRKVELWYQLDAYVLERGFF